MSIELREAIHCPALELGPDSGGRSDHALAKPPPRIFRVPRGRLSLMPKRIPTYRPGPSRQDVSRSYERQRPRQEDKNFYSSGPWLRVRREKLSLNPLCEVCLKDGRYTEATDVHHVLERKDRPDLALDLDNLESLCKPCHGAKRRGQRRG